MDTITLLCNLQAEGPATLRRLRAHGCENLTELLELPLARLATALDADERVAERFQREARALSERCGAETLEPEDPVRMTTPITRPQPMAAMPQASTPAARPMDTPIPPPEHASEVFAPAPPPTRRTRGTALEPGILPGLDEDWCVALQAAGVHTLEILWETSAFELARKVDRPMTGVVDLQCEARQALTRGRTTEIPRPRNPDYTVIPTPTPPTKAAQANPVRVPPPPAVPAPPTTTERTLQRPHKAGYPGEWTLDELRTEGEGTRAGGPFA